MMQRIYRRSSGGIADIGTQPNICVHHRAVLVDPATFSDFVRQYDMRGFTARPVDEPVDPALGNQINDALKAYCVFGFVGFFINVLRDIDKSSHYLNSQTVNDRQTAVTANFDQYISANRVEV